VSDADVVARQVLEESVARVADRWPEVVRGTNIDRTALARIVFSEPQELWALEAIVHPEVERRLVTWWARVLKPAAVEISSASFPTNSLDWYFVVVDSPDHIRRERAIARGMSPEDVDRRMAAQPLRAGWLDRADTIIDNSRNELVIKEAVKRLDRVWRS
jgi:dephospho-CoA kinase